MQQTLAWQAARVLIKLAQAKGVTVDTLWPNPWPVAGGLLREAETWTPTPTEAIPSAELECSQSVDSDQYFEFDDYYENEEWAQSSDAAFSDQLSFGSQPNHDTHSYSPDDPVQVADDGWGTESDHNSTQSVATVDVAASGWPSPDDQDLSSRDDSIFCETSASDPTQYAGHEDEVSLTSSYDSCRSEDHCRSSVSNEYSQSLSSSRAEGILGSYQSSSSPGGHSQGRISLLLSDFDDMILRDTSTDSSSSVRGTEDANTPDYVDSDDYATFFEGLPSSSDSCGREPGLPARGEHAQYEGSLLLTSSHHSDGSASSDSYGREPSPLARGEHTHYGGGLLLTPNHRSDGSSSSDSYSCEPSPPARGEHAQSEGDLLLTSSHRSDGSSEACSVTGIGHACQQCPRSGNDLAVCRDHSDFSTEGSTHGCLAELWIGNDDLAAMGTPTPTNSIEVIQDTEEASEPSHVVDEAIATYPSGENASDYSYDGWDITVDEGCSDDDCDDYDDYNDQDGYDF